MVANVDSGVAEQPDQAGGAQGSGCLLLTRGNAPALVGTPITPSGPRVIFRE